MTEAFHNTVLVSGGLDAFLIPAGGEPKWRLCLETSEIIQEWVNASDTNEKHQHPRVLPNLRISFHLYAYQMDNL